MLPQIQVHEGPVAAHKLPAGRNFETDSSGSSDDRHIFMEDEGLEQVLHGIVWVISACQVQLAPVFSGQSPL